MKKERKTNFLLKKKKKVPIKEKVEDIEYLNYWKYDFA